MRSTKAIAVVAAHADDEILGCGGTLARHAAQGEKVHVLLLADGVGARGAKRGAAAAREGAARRAMKVIGAAAPEFGGFPDNRLDTVAVLDVVQAVEAFLRRVKPSIVYTHHGGDLNVDHRVTHSAVLTACRPLPASRIEAIYTFEVLSSTEWQSPQQSAPFVPQRYVDIAASLERKLEALRCYGEEMRAAPHARSYEGVRALATLRGVQAGLPAAEAFGVLRQLVRT
jgi:LmbE family N-acetylglucosaminyl deacetylase